MQDYVRVCERAARAAGKVLLDWAGRVTVREKGPKDLVTEADLASQRVIREIVAEAFPEHAFLAEEDTGVQTPAGASYRWIVDPLDGTSNYAHGLPHYAVSVALERHGELLAGTVYNPVADECFTAAAGAGAYLNGARLAVSRVSELRHSLVAASLAAQVARGSEELEALVELILAAQSVRRMGSAALNLSYLAAGRFDAFWAADTKSWDVAAGCLLVREAGGVATSVSGGPLVLDNGDCLAAATPALHAQLLAVLRRGEGN